MRITNQLITQVFLVPEIGNKLLQFDSLRWYRSTSGQLGYYEPMTDTVAGPAVLQAQQVSRALAGEKLTLRINGTLLIDLPFTGPDPIDVADVALQLSSISTLIEASGVEGVLTLRTIGVGTGASIEVLASEGARRLGFLTGEAAAGTNTDSALSPGVSEYRQNDYQSGPATWYTVEFRNSQTGVISLRSIAFPSRLQEAVPLNQLIGCFVRLCDLSGRPLGGRRISIHNVFIPNKVSGDGKSWGVFRQYEELVTDPNGYAEVLLVRGAWVDVNIMGTGFTRRIQVPTIGTLVDLLDPALDPRDEFGVQKNDYDFAIRTT